MTEAPPRTLPLIQERYRIESKLGQTRLATVYCAHDERLQRSVLVHLLRKDLLENTPLRQRFLAECQASARRSHPALLEVFDSGIINNRPFLVTEYAVGRSLQQIGALTPDEALLYSRQLSSAIAVCQERGLPHPPISSANVLVVAPGRIKLVENWLTPPEQALLDLAHYRAPERARGEPPSPAGAVYALGVLLFELLVGARPFQGSSPQEVTQASQSGRLPALAQIRPGLFLPSLEQLIAQATGAEPASRPANAAALGQALDVLRGELTRETISVPIPAAPLQQQLRRVASTLAMPRPQASTAAPGAGSPLAPAARRQPGNRRRQGRDLLQAWVVLLLLLVTVVGGGWWLAGVITREVDQVVVPPGLPTLPQPDWQAELWSRLPDWLKTLVPQPQAELVVNATELNMRPEPNTNNQPIGRLPNGARVRLLEGPVSDENQLEWVRVRSLSDGLEGWVALRFLKAE